jgi:hypothetical protein
MSTTIQFILTLLAFVCFFLSALNVVAPRVNFIGLGLTFFTLRFLIS